MGIPVYTGNKGIKGNLAMGSSQSKDIGRVTESQENKQTKYESKRKFDYWRSLFPEKDTSPKPESNGERIQRLTDEVQSAYDRICKNQVILSKLRYTNNEFTKHYDDSLKVQQKAWEAYLHKA